MDDDVILTIALRRGPDGQSILALAGEFDLRGEAEVALAICQALDDGTDGDGDDGGARPDLIIDLSELTFMGSRGVRTLLEVRALADYLGRKLAVVGAHGPVLRLLEMTGVRKELGVLEDGTSEVDGDGGVAHPQPAVPGH